MRKPQFTERAENELMQVILFYEGRVLGLGEKFGSEVQRSLKIILENPFLGTQARKGIRKWSLHRFPYSIIYSFDEMQLRILTIFHAKRKPLFRH